MAFYYNKSNDEVDNNYKFIGNNKSIVISKLGMGYNYRDLQQKLLYVFLIK